MSVTPTRDRWHRLCSLPGAVLGAGLALVLASCAVSQQGSSPTPVHGSSASSPAATPSSEYLASSFSALCKQELDTGGKDSENGLSALETEVLQRAVVTGGISSADYESAHAAFMECMAQHGVQEPWKKAANGVYYPQAYDTTKVSFTTAQLYAARDACEPENDDIERLYQIQQSNPTLLADPLHAGVTCLRSVGLVDASYTAEQLKKDLDAANAGTGALPFSPFDPSATGCLNIAGYYFVQGP